MGIEKIRYRKNELKMTTEDLSKLSGVPIGTLNKILSGQTSDPKFETLKAICRALNLKLSELEDDYEPETIAAHHDSEEWTEDELDEIEEFKKYVLSKRK